MFYRSILFIFFSLLLTACGGGGSSQANNNPISNTPPPSNPVPQPEPQPETQPETPNGKNYCVKPALNPVKHKYQIASRAMNYPATVRSLDNPNKLLMFTGDFAHKASPTMLVSTPRGDNHIRFQSAQEELWVGELNNSLDGWAVERRYAIGIEPETKVTAQANAKYHDLYPQGFATSCYQGFQDQQCNVQINDASVITLERHGKAMYLLYFTIFENYRWHSPALGDIGAAGPSNPREQNRHAIGLATSTDAKTWTFYDKVIGESELDLDGKEVLGAWSPSALAYPETGKVEVYFHDALGTAQYVADLAHGSDLLSIKRINPQDNIYRTNLDVLKTDEGIEVLYNNATFDIVRTGLDHNKELVQNCEDEVLEVAPEGTLLPTPHQIINQDGQRYMFYWNHKDDDAILVNVY